MEPARGDAGPPPAAVTARPVKMSRIFYASAAFVLAVFVVVALLEKRDNAGAYLNTSSQIATVIIGVILAGGLLLFTRPRLWADHDQVRVRGVLGSPRVLPWDVVVRVEFPRSARFARLVLPGEEIVAIYAVQRMDKEYAVTAMRQLRVLFAATHPVA